MRLAKPWDSPTEFHGSAYVAIFNAMRVVEQGEPVVKAFIKKLAKRYGYEILGPPRAFASQQSLIALIRQEQINLVLDVGANTGQFVTDLRAAGYTGHVISFEPLAEAHALLCKHAEIGRASCRERG